MSNTPVSAVDPPWHTMEPAAALARLDVDLDSGLTSDTAEARHQDVGPNRLDEQSRRPAWRLFVDQFRNVLILVLVGAAVLAGLVGDFKDTAVITVVLVINAVLGFVQEHRAEQSLAALRGMLAPVARVRRDSVVVELPAEQLVPGDIVLLEAGARVPADGRIVVANALEVDESALTGESVAVSKDTAGVPAESPLADRTGMVHTNTVVTRGRGEIVVTGTGMTTEIGKLAGMLQSAQAGDTPLQVQLHVLGKRLAGVAAVAVCVFFVLGVARGQEIGETLLASVALAVAAIPEGLPAVVTVTLAVGINQMAKRGAIVKRLASVETLGATTVICSDKTGTLTLNQMTGRLAGVGGQILELPSQPDPDLQNLLRAGVLCNDSTLHGGSFVGAPTETALLRAAAEHGVEADSERRKWPRIAELPFESAHKLMATVHDNGGDLLLVVKGAPDVLLRHCTAAVWDGGRRALDADLQRELQDVVESIAEKGLRVLAVAQRNMSRRPSANPDGVSAQIEDLTLLGFVGMQDPPRPEARDAIATCKRAGVAVKMITGDHAATARAIARELGIVGDVLTGQDLERMSDPELRHVVDHTGVFARVAPEHKVRIVRALKAEGHVVAMTGDGVNDAPALKTADIGVAMGITGTEVSKEAAAMVLTDDNFATIVRAVHAGRTIYENILKFVRFQLSTNLGAILSLLGAQIAGLPVPFSAVQILWVNIIMDGPPAMALGMDPGSPASMERKPRDPHDGILTLSRLIRLTALGGVMAAGTLGVLTYWLRTSDEASALALAFTTFVLFQVFNAFNARSEETTVFSRESLRNAKLWVALSGVVLLQIAAVQVPALQSVFGTTGLTLREWAIAAGVASSILWLEELRKLIVRVRGSRAAGSEV